MEVLPFAVLGHVQGILSCHTEMAGRFVGELKGVFLDVDFRLGSCHHRNNKGEAQLWKQTCY